MTKKNYILLLHITIFNSQLVVLCMTFIKSRPQYANRKISCPFLEQVSMHSHRKRCKARKGMRLKQQSSADLTHCKTDTVFLAKILNVCLQNVRIYQR